MGEPDLLPLLAKQRSIKIVTSNPTGNVNMMRLNHLQPPFDNPKILQALLYAVDQQACMEAYVGSDTSMFYTPHGVFCPKTPTDSSAGLEPLQARATMPRPRR